MNLKTKTAPPDATRSELRARVNELANINDDLFDLIREQREGYQKAIENVLLTFAARGYQPAARALLEFRRAFSGTKAKDTH